MSVTDFQSTVARGDGETVVSLFGELDVASSQRLTEELLGLIDGGATCVVIDLGQLAFIDSTGLSALIQANKKMSGKGKLRLRTPTPLVRQVLEVTGLMEALRVEP